ncbi:MAG: aminopeptidase P N-terminal domain-containing protein [Myxococcales bacterium]|nr:aminopeptidase P N-terminal domain-containing protein [Myxococcales bacterium]
MMSPFGERRRRVLDALGSAVLLLPAAPLAIRNNDVEHEYRQDSDFFYLTGFDEPESVFCLRGGKDAPMTLFVRPRDPEREVWDGPRAGVEGAVRDLGADVAHPIAELAQKLPELLENSERLYYRLGLERSFDEVVLSAIDRVRARAKLGVSWPVEIVDPATIIHELRRVKARDELSLMRRAAEITRDAHLAAMAKAKPGVYEYEVEAEISAVFRRHGSERPAYGSIVGSGPNATVLHYRKNDRKMVAGDLLLVDAGCEYGYYASDVTRTFPIAGKFSAPQRAIYELVLEAQRASIDATRPGATLEQIHDASVQVIARGLVQLGLLEGPLEQVLEKQTYKKFFMHRTSHYLGMDVHDVGRYFVAGKARPLDTGVVITVEPGIYVAENAEGVPEQYRGIGVRIEDDVLVSSEGPSVLTSDVPRSVDDVERACA